MSNTKTDNKKLWRMFWKNIARIFFVPVVPVLAIPAGACTALAWVFEHLKDVFVVPLFLLIAWLKGKDEHAPNDSVGDCDDIDEEVLNDTAHRQHLDLDRIRNVPLCIPHSIGDGRTPT